MVFDKAYVVYVYGIMKHESYNLDAIYKDHIIYNVGVFGFNALHEYKLIESCGVVNGRQLYVLCDKK